MMRTRMLVVAAAATAALGGCAIRPKPTLSGSAVTSGVANPFCATSLAIHPLTRADRDAKGKLWVICHVELRDSWGDTCKAIGKLSIQLYRPVGGRASGLGTQELSWDVDLTDLERNASLYDPATRTYRLPLEDAPSWLFEGKDRKSDLPVARLRAVFVTTGPKGEERVLEDEFALGG